MKLGDLPEISFTDVNKDVVVATIMKQYKEITGRTLGKADPVRLFLLVIANVIILLLNKINEVGKQNLLAYARGENLDHIGAALGVARLEPMAATTTMKLTLSAVRNSAVTIPKGIRFTAGDAVVFATNEDVILTEGKLSVEVKATCLQAGDVGNGYLVGTITELMDPLPYVAKVENITISEGGANMEDDERFRLRIHEAPESFSCAGSVGAYEYHTKKVSSLIESATVVSPEPGEVVVYPVLEGGNLPQEELKGKVLDALNDRYVRPLTDKVTIGTPTEKRYTINIKYFIAKKDMANLARIKERVEKAVDEYIVWQKSMVGRDINPSELTYRVMSAGAKRVEVTAPVFTKVKSGDKSDGYIVEIAINSGKTVTYGGLEDE